MKTPNLHDQKLYNCYKGPVREGEMSRTCRTHGDLRYS